MNSTTSLNRSHLFRRAHQLAAWNRQPSRPTPFGQWLRLAWAELRSGKSATWSFVEPTALAIVEQRIETLEHTDRLGVAGLAQLRAAYAEHARLAA